MGAVEHQIDVHQPLHTVYAQWAQFESFPSFMSTVEDVRRLDERHVHWKVKIGGVAREWDAEIIDQTPDAGIRWTSTRGTRNSGVVSFERLDEDTTRVVLIMTIEPKGLLEYVADKLELADSKVVGELERFRDHVEAAPRARDRDELES
jgi:uncharacterized membrane protein